MWGSKRGDSMVEEDLVDKLEMTTGKNYLYSVLSFFSISLLLHSSPSFLLSLSFFILLLPPFLYIQDGLWWGQRRNGRRSTQSHAETRHSFHGHFSQFHMTVTWPNAEIHSNFIKNPKKTDIIKWHTEKGRWGVVLFSVHPGWLAAAFWRSLIMVELLSSWYNDSCRVHGVKATHTHKYTKSSYFTIYRTQIFKEKTCGFWDTNNLMLVLQTYLFSHLVYIIITIELSYSYISKISYR